MELQGWAAVIVSILILWLFVAVVHVLIVDKSGSSQRGALDARIAAEKQRLRQEQRETSGKKKREVKGTARQRHATTSI